MLSDQHRFLFLHIPRTGGNAVQTALAPFSEDRLVASRPRHDGVHRFGVERDGATLTKHSTLAEYRAALGDDALNGYRIFATARNTWDRIASSWAQHLAHAPNARNDAASFIAFLDRVQPMRAYIARDGDQSLEDAAQGLWRCMRYDRLGEDFANVCRNLGFPELKLLQINAAPRLNNAALFTREARSIIEARFADEIELFGFRMKP